MTRSRTCCDVLVCLHVSEICPQNLAGGTSHPVRSPNRNRESCQSSRPAMEHQRHRSLHGTLGFQDSKAQVWGIQLRDAQGAESVHVCVCVCVSMSGKFGTNCPELSMDYKNTAFQAEPQPSPNSRTVAWKSQIPSPKLALKSTKAHPSPT